MSLGTPLAAEDAPIVALAPEASASKRVLRSGIVNGTGAPAGERC